MECIYCGAADWDIVEDCLVCSVCGEEIDNPEDSVVDMVAEALAA